MADSIRLLSAFSYAFLQAFRIRLPHWKQDVGIRLRKAQDDYETRAAGQPTHDYLTAASRHGYIPWTPTQIELLSDDWQLCDITGKVIAE